MATYYHLAFEFGVGCILVSFFRPTIHSTSSLDFAIITVAVWAGIMSFLVTGLALDHLFVRIIRKKGLAFRNNMRDTYHPSRRSDRK